MYWGVGTAQGKLARWPTDWQLEFPNQLLGGLERASPAPTAQDQAGPHAQMGKKATEKDNLDINEIINYL